MLHMIKWGLGREKRSLYLPYLLTLPCNAYSHENGINGNI